VVAKAWEASDQQQVEATLMKTTKSREFYVEDRPHQPSEAHSAADN
jgi:hypothetical protein